MRDKNSRKEAGSKLRIIRTGGELTEQIKIKNNRKEEEKKK